MPNFFLLSSLSTPPASSWSRVFFCWRKVRCDTLITCRMRMACVEFTYTSKLNHSINVFDELVDLSIYSYAVLGGYMQNIETLIHAHRRWRFVEAREV